MKYFLLKRFLLVSTQACFLSALAQTTSFDDEKRLGVGLSLSSVSRFTLGQSTYSSIAGTGYESGLRFRYWRAGLTFLFGHTAMQVPDIENLEYNRIHVVGGNLEYRLGAKQRGVLFAGYHRHIYHYKTKEMQLMYGITARSILNEIEQRASLLGGALQVRPYLRVGIHYEWERVAQKNIRGIRPSSSYLVFRASFMLDSNHLKSQKSATGI